MKYDAVTNKILKLCTISDRDDKYLDHVKQNFPQSMNLGKLIKSLLIDRIIDVIVKYWILSNYHH